MTVISAALAAPNLLQPVMLHLFQHPASLLSPVVAKASGTLKQVQGDGIAVATAINP